MANERPPYYTNVTAAELFLQPLVEVDASDGWISGTGLANLRFNTSITKLSLAVNSLDPSAGEYLALNTTITDLDLSKNELGDKGAVALAHNTTITKLDISGNNVFDGGLVALAACTSIRTLVLGEYDDVLNDEQISVAATNAWANNTTLTRLEIDGYDDFTAAIVRTNTTLMDLKLSAVSVGVGDALVKNTSITALEVYSAWNTSMGKLAKKESLTSLSVHEAQIIEETAIWLTEHANLMSFRVECVLRPSPSAAIALSKWDAFMYLGEVENGYYVQNMRRRVAQNQQRLKDLKHVFAMACVLVFGLKKAIRKRLQIQ